MELNERISKVWKDSGLTMSKFGERIGITNSSVSTMISGKSNPSEQTLKFISCQFNVREEWLRTEEGEIYKPQAVDTVLELAREYKLDAQQTALVRRFLRLKPETWADLIAAVEDVAGAFAEPSNGKNVHYWNDAEVMAEVRRQLDAEKSDSAKGDIDGASTFGLGSSGMGIA